MQTIIRPAAIGAVLFAFSFGATAHGDAKAPTADEIVAGIRNAEHQIRNIRVSGFEGVMERLPHNSAKWERAELRLAGTWWSDGPSGLKSRLNLNQSVMRWLQGVAPTAESVVDMGYDGQFGRTVTHRAGPEGRTQPARLAQIEKTAPTLLTDRHHLYATGALFSIAFRHRDDRPFSVLFAEAVRAKRGPIEIARDQVNGIDAVRVRFGGGTRSSATHWFDPSRGYARIRYEAILSINGVMELSELDEVFAMAEAAPGVWYPTSAQHTERTPGQPDARMQRMVYTAREVKVNDPAFGDDVFVVPIPPGYRVDDHTAGPQAAAK